jgi:hypothetical protein
LGMFKTLETSMVETLERLGTLVMFETFETLMMDIDLVDGDRERLKRVDVSDVSEGDSIYCR